MWDSELLSKTALQATLVRAFKKRRESPFEHRYADPTDTHIDLDWMHRHQDRVLSVLLHELKTGRHSLSPHVRTRVKLDKERDLYLCNWADRIILMRMAEILTSFLEPRYSTNLYSFRKGKGSHLAILRLSRAIKKSRGPVWILKRDISAYGDSISQDRILEMLGSLNGLRKSPIFWSLIQQAVRIQYWDRQDPEKKIQLLIQGIPSGSPLTPVLENLYLQEIDSRVGDEITKGEFYGRYGDDFLVMSLAEKSAQTRSIEIDRICQSLGLTMKASKRVNALFIKGTPFHSPPPFKPVQSIEWLGCRVDERGRLGPKVFRLREIRRELKRSIYRSSWGLLNIDMPQELRISLLQRRLSSLLDPQENQRLGGFIYEPVAASVLAQLDREIVRWIVDSTRAHLRMRKREAWRTFRKMNLILIQPRRMAK